MLRELQPRASAQGSKQSPDAFNQALRAPRLAQEVLNILALGGRCSTPRSHGEFAIGRGYVTGPDGYSEKIADHFGRLPYFQVVDGEGR